VRSFLIQYYTDRIPGFGSKSLALPDLFAVCEADGIEVFRTPFDRLHGCAFFQDDAPFIFINSTLPAAEQVIAGWHEYDHLTRHMLKTHCPYNCVFTSSGSMVNLSRIEREAQIVGCLALMPHPLVVGLSLEDIMREFGVSRNTAEFRASLLQ
jgi:Zn-dependent peptidase ImmA (M78 family)